MKQQRRTERALLVASVLAAVTLPSYAATGIQDNSAAFTTNAVNAPVVNAQDAAQYKQAEKAKADKTVHIEPISVTAAGFTQLVKNSPADITVITKEEIARKNYTDFAGLLSDVEGIDVRGSNGRMGAAGVSIRGMDQKYTLIMVDGVPVNGASSQDIGPNGMYQQIYSFIPPANSIERIEVVRGPMSTLYGSDALGGAINIITKKITNEVHGNISVDHTFETDEGRGDTTRTSMSIRGPLQKDKVGMELRGSYIYRQNSTLEDGSTVRGAMRTPSELKNYSLGTKVTWTPTMDNTYWIDLDKSRVDQSGDNTGNNLGMRFDRQKYVFAAENIKSYGIWNTTLTYNDTAMKGYTFTDTNRQTRARDMKDKNYIGETKLEMTKWADHHATFGFRYWKEKLDDSMLREGGSTSPKLGVLENDTWALYAEDTWSVAPKLDFTYGVRYEHPDKFDDHFTPRGYLVYKATDKWTVKGGVSTGFRVPTLAQTQSGIVGFTGGRGNPNPIYIHGNPNLQPEKSVNKEIGFYYSNPNGVRGHVTYFNTDYKNKIDTIELDARNQMYTNTDRGKAQGVEFAYRTPIADDVNFNVNYTFTSSKITSGDYKGSPLTATPKHMVNAKIDWDANERTNVWFGMEYRNRIARYAGSTTANAKVVKELGKYYKSYAVFNLGASYKFDRGITLNAQINNIFDKDFDKSTMIDGTEYNYYYSSGKATGGTYLAGRSYWLSIGYNF